MNEKIRVERPEMSGWVEVPVDICCPKCRMLQRQVNNWREIACALYNAAHEQDYTVMRDALKRYEDAEGD